MIRGKISRPADRKNSTSITLDIFPHVPPFLTILSVCGATYFTPSDEWNICNCSILDWVGKHTFTFKVRYTTFYLVVFK